MFFFLTQTSAFDLDKVFESRHLVTRSSHQMCSVRKGVL